MYVFRVLLTYWLASLFQTLFSLCSVSAAAAYLEEESMHPSMYLASCLPVGQLISNVLNKSGWYKCCVYLCLHLCIRRLVYLPVGQLISHIV
jgi:hypothetical protein